MPRFIVKPKRDEDFYVEWSTIVDDWTWAGSKQELRETGHEEERIERADENGSSAFPTFFWWDHTEFTLGQYPYGAGCRAFVRREQLREYIETQWNSGDPLPLTDPRLEPYITLEPWED